MSVSYGSSEKEREEVAFPENMKYVEVGRGEISVPVDGDEDWLDEPEFEDYEIEPRLRDPNHEGTIRFKKGDYLPLTVAEDVFPAYKDILVLKGGNHQEISRGVNVDVDTSEKIH
jgi:hypothetical protein